MKARQQGSPRRLTSECHAVAAATGAHEAPSAPAPAIAHDDRRRPHPLPDPIRPYEELDGAEGRAVFFRPQRYTAVDLQPLRAEVEIGVHGVKHACTLRDVSQSGVALEVSPGVVLAEETRLELSLRFGEHEAYRGEGRVGSIRSQGRATVVGVSFHDFLLDVDELLELRNMRRWGRLAPSFRLEARPWALQGSERYKSLVADLRLFYEDARGQLDALERSLPWHVLHGPDNPARRALVEQLRTEFVADAVRLTEEVDAAVREVPDGFGNGVAKEWSRRHVHDFIMLSPCCLRALRKPFGYPGDYGVMDFIYERNFEGATLFARTVQLGFAHVRSSLGVRGRKDLVKQEIRSLLEQRAGSGRPVRVLSIAAGPAQELAELLSELPEVPAPLEVVLFEQDKNALAHASRRLGTLVQPQLSGRVRLRFLHDSIKRLLRDPALFAEVGKFDLVYSCGLYDYLQDRTAVGLTRHLMAAVGPQGRLLVANMVDNASRWLLDFHLDWPLVYRTREQLLEIARRAAPDQRARVVEETSGINPFFEILRD